MAPVPRMPQLIGRLASECAGSVSMLGAGHFREAAETACNPGELPQSTQDGERQCALRRKPEKRENHDDSGFLSSKVAGDKRRESGHDGGPCLDRESG